MKFGPYRYSVTRLSGLDFSWLRHLLILGVFVTGKLYVRTETVLVIAGLDVLMSTFDVGLVWLGSLLDLYKMILWH